jgi:hypothetical protein
MMDRYPNPNPVCICRHGFLRNDLAIVLAKGSKAVDIRSYGSQGN